LLRITGGKERIRHYIEHWAPPDGAVALRQVAAMHAEKTARYAALVDAGAAKLRPGIKRLVLESREKGVMLAIATTTTRDNVEALLRVTFGADSPGWFAVIAAGDIVPRKKPAPDIYHYACEQLGAARAACIAFEDSENGVRAAREACLTVVATPSFYSSGDNFSGATSILTDLGEPGEPFRHLAGVPFGSGCVDLASLGELLGAAAKPAQKPASISFS
jgi:beta-phosphoglucomutase-like phosphatase (HAD superfamily)